MSDNDHMPAHPPQRERNADGRIRRVVGGRGRDRDPLERLAELNTFVARLRPDGWEPEDDDFVRVVVGGAQPR